MHHIYHTEGIILKSKNFGETGKYYQIFTRDFGLVYASASGVRKISSRLRFVLQDFSYIKLDLILSKDIFKITSASKTSILEDITKRTETLKIFANMGALLRRLLAGIEPNRILFDDFVAGLCALEKLDDEEGSRDLEAVIVLRMLSNLGYLGTKEELKYLIGSPFVWDLASLDLKNRKVLLSQINQALRETHL